MKSLKKVYNKEDGTVTEYFIMSGREMIIEQLKYEDLDGELKALVDEAVNQYEELDWKSIYQDVKENK